MKIHHWELAVTNETPVWMTSQVKLTNVFCCENIGRTSTNKPHKSWCHAHHNQEPQGGNWQFTNHWPACHVHKTINHAVVPYPGYNHNARQQTTHCCSSRCCNLQISKVLSETKKPLMCLQSQPQYLTSRYLLSSRWCNTEQKCLPQFPQEIALDIPTRTSEHVSRYTCKSWLY